MASPQREEGSHRGKTKQTNSNSVLKQMLMMIIVDRGAECTASAVRNLSDQAIVSQRDTRYLIKARRDDNIHEKEQNNLT